jgi:hypothetical protein
MRRNLLRKQNFGAKNGDIFSGTKPVAVGLEKSLCHRNKGFRDTLIFLSFAV